MTEKEEIEDQMRFVEWLKQNDMYNHYESANTMRKMHSVWKKFDNMTKELRKWHDARNALSSECKELGISGTASDSGRWGAELDKRCEPLRKFCTDFFRKEK